MEALRALQAFQVVQTKACQMRKVKWLHLVFHYMPDGTLMSDAEHARLYGEQQSIQNIEEQPTQNTREVKTIRSFDIKTSDIPAGGTTRAFKISGDKGALFSMEVFDNDGNYYNFMSKTWRASRYILSKKSIKGSQYNGSIKFSEIASKLHVYTIRLFAETTDCVITKFSKRKEIRNANNTINENLSTGSNSNMITKQIHQALASNKILKIRAIAPEFGDGGEVWNGSTPSLSSGAGEQQINFGEVDGDLYYNFTITKTAASGKSISIVRQPTENDFLAFRFVDFGATPITLGGENIWAGAARSTDKTVNGAVTSGTNVTMDDDVGSFWAVGDRITGNAALDAKTDADAVTITAINVDVGSGANAKIFTMSEAVAIADGETLTFTEPQYYKWSINNVAELSSGMVLDKSSTTGGNVTAGSYIKSYLSRGSYTLVDTVDCEQQEKTIYYNIAGSPGVETTADATTVSRSGYTTAQAGNITFNNQQKLAIASDTNVKILGYGPDSIARITGGLELEFRNLKAEILESNKITTTTTSSTSHNASTTVAVAEQDGILIGYSIIDGIGINTARSQRVVTAKAGATGAGNITLSAAQALESGASLDFNGAAKIITITGSVKIKGTPDSSLVIYLDIEKFLISA